MDLPTTADKDHIRHGLRLLDVNHHELDWHGNYLTDSLPRGGLSHPSVGLRTPLRDSLGSLPSPISSIGASSWSTDGYVPSTNFKSGPSHRQLRTSLPRDQQPPTGRSLRHIASNMSQHSLYPAPTGPLPPIPPSKSTVRRHYSTDSHSLSSISTTRSSRSNFHGSYTEAALPSPVTTTSPNFAAPKGTEGYGSFPDRVGPPLYRPLSQRSMPKPSSLHFWKDLVSDDKKVNNSVHYLDISPSATVLASKHGHNLVKVWSLASGELQNVIKFSSYTEAKSRSRDYMIRSHAILSEASTLIAIATRFGRSISIFDWTRRKSIQSIGDADRWTAGRFDMFDGGRCPLAIYRAESATIDVYLATQEKKKPLYKQCSIELAKAGLPFTPILPELAISATSPLVVAAAGPRPPIAGHPPPKRETLLVAWEISDQANPENKPYRVARPWQHSELDTAIPIDLVTYGSVVVSIWIPASFRAVPVPASRKGSGYNLTSVKVPLRHVLVWDLSANSTRTFAIPNCISCISPDCRLVAYCDASGAEIGARGSVVILDVITGDEVWCWPDRNAINARNSFDSGFRQFHDLGRVTELSFSADARFLVVGDGGGRMGVYDVRASN
ncbi:WD40 repeat-like-containing domain [Cordyceps militaris CM01]|uniref:WD40 repeat-like-containing domain n=1 Tax=Cordyceps militaris (strain CM01) TaxID=983644 RepID=G3JC68_CORMM|nr:WD40 repeat-like-containing domain [Cordyceps militaris CM01]EGX94583.1 WD40 repeat-like-containing domain [Cordyceps militaris CM01]